MAVKQTFTVDDRDLERAYARLEAQNTKLLEQNRRLAQSARQNQDANEKAFDPAIVTAYESGIRLIGRAYQTLTQYATQAAEEARSVAQALLETVEGQKRLWQVAESREVYEGLSAQVKTAMATEGMTRQQAQDLAFNLKSLNRMEALPTIAQSARFMDPAVSAGYYTTLSADVNWGRGAGTPQQLLSGLIAGAGASKYNTAETADWMTRAAPTLKNIGATPAEIMGVGAAMSPATANSQTLATYMMSLEKGVSKWKATAGDEWAEYQGLKEPKKREKFLEERAMTEEELRSRAGRAAGATGLIAGFEAMRTDAGAYEDTKTKETEFKRAALALEGALELAKQNTATIEAAFKSDALFRQKTEELPGDIRARSRAAKGASLRELSLEELAGQQELYKYASDAAVAARVASGKSHARALLKEDLVGKAADLGAVQFATEKMFEDFAANLPKDIFEETMAGQFQRRERTIPASPMLPELHEVTVDIPRQLNPAQLDALEAAADALARRIAERAQKNTVPAGSRQAAAQLDAHGE